MNIFFRLTRFYLSLAVSLSAIFSYLIIVETPSVEILLPFLGVLLLALGTSALNQIQEVKFDSKMQRTLNRPLVAKQISIFDAYFITLFLIVSSFIVIYISLDLYGIYFFIFTIVTYNIIYTYTKRVSYWALILGSFLGVVSPSIGWFVSGSSFFDIRFLFLFLLYFIWQVPHFWLLMLMNGKDYKRAGFPTLKDKIGKRGLKNTVSIWYFLTIFIGLFLVYSFRVHLNIWLIYIFISAYAVYSAYLIPSTKKRLLKIRFMELNTYVLLTMILLVINNLGNF